METITIEIGHKNDCETSYYLAPFKKGSLCMRCYVLSPSHTGGKYKIIVKNDSGFHACTEEQLTRHEMDRAMDELIDRGIISDCYGEYKIGENY